VRLLATTNQSLALEEAGPPERERKRERERERKRENEGEQMRAFSQFFSRSRSFVRSFVRSFARSLVRISRSHTPVLELVPISIIPAMHRESVLARYRITMNETIERSNTRTSDRNAFLKSQTTQAIVHSSTLIVSTANLPSRSRDLEDIQDIFGS